MGKNTINDLSGKFFTEMADMVEATTVAIDMIDNTPKTHNYDFTMTAVRELLETVNETSFRLMLMSSEIVSQSGISTEGKY